MPVKFIVVLNSPVHKVWSPTGSAIGAGLTVITKDSGVPGQPSMVGVTVMVELIAVSVGLVSVNGGIFPVPLAANEPIAVLLFVQL